MKNILIGTLIGLREFIDKYGADYTVLEIIEQIRKEEQLENMYSKISEGC